jgi:hypothetical protein
MAPIRIGLIVTIVAFGSGPVSEGWTSSQSVTRELRLVVAAPRPGPLYPPPVRRGRGHIVFLGEPLIVTAALTNDSDMMIELREPDGWVGALGIDLLTPDRQIIARFVPFDVLRVRNRNSGAATTSLLRPGESLWIELRLRPAIDLEPREYVVRARVDRASFRSDLKRIPVVVLEASTPLEIVPVTSREDRLSVLYAKGVRQRVAGSLKEARETLTLLLAQEPNTVSGWYELGLVAIEQGSCSEGTDAFARARQAMTLGANKGRRWTGPESAMERLMAEAVRRCTSR